MTSSNGNSFKSWARSNWGAWAWGTLPCPRSSLGLNAAERETQRFESWLARWHQRLLLPFKRWPTRRSRVTRLLNQIEARRAHWTTHVPADLHADAQQVAWALQQGLLSDRVLVDAFSLIDEALHRTRGFHFHRVQLQAGLHLLLGELVEMATGEGKTLTALLPAATMALAKTSVHVVTVNDYLTERDALEVQPVLAALNLRVAWVVHELSPEQKRQAYAADVTYVTNKELVFDYLRDRAKEIERGTLATQVWLHAVSTSSPLVKQLDFAIVDEADSVLIDEANIPLILTEPTERGLSPAFVTQAIDLAAKADPSWWERSDALGNQSLRPEHLQALINSLEAPAIEWRSHVLAQEMLAHAKLAQERYHKDVQYIIEEDKLVLIDDQTGRPMPDRSLPWGLQQLIEVREGLPPSNHRRTLAKLSYQKFFRKYHALCGMSGTLAEVRSELRMVYRVPIARVPTHRAVQRRMLQQRLFANESAKLDWTLQRCVSLCEAQRAVLIGVSSVALSERISQRLTEQGLPHRVLNAKRLPEEAEVVARAGQAQTITVVTNMAGRGTDIKLPNEVKAAGGLHVIIMDMLESSRLDRQLYGRAGRQGDPGSYDVVHSLDEPAVKRLMGKRRLALLTHTLRFSRGLSTRLYFGLLDFSRRRLEGHKRRQRIQLLESDDKRDELLSFTRRL